MLLSRLIARLVIFFIKSIDENYNNTYNTYEKIKIKDENMINNEIIMASGNKGKIAEAQEILKEYKIITMKELGV